MRNAAQTMTALEVFSQQVINGLTTGSYLALIALGYTMVYGLIELINFAHGDIYALGFFFSLTLFTWLGVPRTLVAALPASHAGVDVARGDAAHHAGHRRGQRQPRSSGL